MPDVSWQAVWIYGQKYKNIFHFYWKDHDANQLRFCYSSNLVALKTYSCSELRDHSW